MIDRDNYLKSLPPIPTIPKFEAFNKGITTRIMAKRQLQNENRDSINYDDVVHNIQTARRPSKFLTGAAIPNSTVRASLKSQELQMKTENLANKAPNPSLTEDSKFKRISFDETRRESTLERLKRMQKEYNEKQLEASKKAAEDVNKKLHQANERRRISQRTSNLELFQKRRRSTVESIKQAIEKSEKQDNLLDVDNIEMRQRFSENYKSSIAIDLINKIMGDQTKNQKAKLKKTTKSLKIQTSSTIDPLPKLVAVKAAAK